MSDTLAKKKEMLAKLHKEKEERDKVKAEMEKR
jgi:hypothetical protein